MQIADFFARCWDDYATMAPQAPRIRAAFESRDETVVNDHVAFRTLALEPIGLATLEALVLELGYRPFAPYQFPSKHLRAVGYLPPEPDQPRIFLSELLVDELPGAVGSILRRCAAAVDPQRLRSPEVLWSGTLWPVISTSEYRILAETSEYAAWVATIGLRPNHFTISVNHLRHHRSLEAVLQVVESLGCAINDSGGRIKGSPEQGLEQAATLADTMPVVLAEGQPVSVPTCYYEFAKRYPVAGSELFQGFVAGSADRIFESTDRREERDD